MSQPLQPGHHLDADSLSAFVEGVLPQHERLQCLSHLAECGRCRELAFLAQEPIPVDLIEAEEAPWWRRWFAPMPVLGAAAAICVVVFGVWLYVQRPSPPAIAELSRERPGTPIPLEEAPQARTVISPEVKKKKVASGQARRPIPAEVTASLPAAPEIAVQAAPIAEPPRNPLARITGTVTDPTGAVISSANVVLRQRAGALSTSVQTDSQGRFEVADLPPGQYELRIGAPGFREESRRVELQPQEVAAVTSQLSIGSVSETVEVTAAPPQIQTESSSMSQSRVRPLPNKLPIAFSVESGKVMLAVDSAGKLFRSGNSGKSWKAIKAIWSGKVARLELADTATAQFRLTTDSEAVWLSRDGSRWFAASR